MPSLLIKGGRIVDPSSGFDDISDIFIIDGKIVEISKSGEIKTPHKPDKEIDAAGLHVFPGLIDVHVHFRDPGFTHKEDFASGAKAALAGGFTSVIQMPNTNPALSTPDLIREYTRNEPIRSYVSAAVTKDRGGKNLNDLKALQDAGAVAFTDDGSPVSDESLMSDALVASRELGLRIMTHAENLELSKGGAIIEGDVAEKLGVIGINRDAESSMVERDIELANDNWAKLHICHVSTKKSVELIRAAKADGIPITAEVTPHHLLLNHEAVLDHGANAKMNPPLAYEEDRLACIDGLLDGTLDIIATDHAPHSKDEKASGLADAPFGIVGLETSFPLLYTNFVVTSKLTLNELIEKMSTLPAEIFGLLGGGLEIGSVADIAIFDLENEYTIDAKSFHSKSRNTPFNGCMVKGKIKFTIVNGAINNDL